MSNSPRTVRSTKMNIKIVGCILSPSFQTTKFILMNLVKYRSDLISKYIIKSVMDIEWTRCLWKLNQSLNGLKLYSTEAIFVNKNYIGTNVEFQKYLATHYDFTINLWPINYKQFIWSDIQNYYNNYEFTFIRMVFSVNNWKIGYVVFSLFHKLVPKTCEYFKQLCLDNAEGYLNSIIHRIDIDNGFIQAGRSSFLNTSNKIPYFKKENFLVSHDRRGVLSLANEHTFFNGPEFIISLQPNSWMNNKYVAFGHVVEGEKTLNTIEALSNAYRTFNSQLCISSCDVLGNCTRPIEKSRLKTF